jgi:hypothetical protein
VRLLEINLATRPFRNNTLYWAGFGSAALALAALSVWNVWLFLGHGTTMRQRQEEFTVKEKKRDELARDERRLSLKLTKLDFKGLSQQAEFANDAIRRRAFSWTRLFNRLEEVVPPTVMMVAIRPEIQADGISIVGEGSAKEQEGLLSFEENLIRNRYFSRIYPGSERREQRGQDIRFSLKFDYVPEGRPGFAEGGPEEKAEKSPKKESPPPVQAEASAKPEGPATTAAAPSAPKIAAAAPAIPGGSPGAAGQRPGTVTSPAPPAGAPAPSAASSPAAPPATAGATPAHPYVAVPPPGDRVPPRTGGGRRPPLKAGAVLGRRRGNRAAFGAEAEKSAEEQAAARFNDQPLQDVFDYLMKSRNMTFVFAGDFDLRQKVTIDLNSMEEPEIVGRLSHILDCVASREGMHAYRLSPKSGGEPLEEPPVEEEPAPPEDGGDDSGTEAP